MFSSWIFTITSALSLALIITAIVFQVMEMHTYGMLPFRTPPHKPRGVCRIRQTPFLLFSAAVRIAVFRM